MIVVCPKALASNDSLSLERNFLKYYLSICKKKEKLANEVWETFRYKTLQLSADKDGAYERIAEYRGMFEPETLVLNAEFQEEEPKKEYSTEQMKEKTKSFLERNWADVELFITQTPENYKDLCKTKDIPLMSLSEFYLDCMSNDKNRDLLMRYWYKIYEEGRE